MEENELKRRVRKLKRLELRLRFGGSATAPEQPDLEPVFF